MQIEGETTPVHPVVLASFHCVALEVSVLEQLVTVPELARLV